MCGFTNMTGCLCYNPLLNLILEVQFNTYIEVGVNIVSGADPEFGQRGQLLRLKVTKAAEQSCVSKASYMWPGSRACLRTLEVFGFLMLKYALSHILQTLFLSF